MKQFSFEATGTQWTLLVDQEVSQTVFDAVRNCAVEFEERFSRFREDSEVGQINRAAVTQLQNGPHFQDQNNQESIIKELMISDEFAEMLVFGKELQTITDGYFDVNVAAILESHGYDRNYSFKKNEELLSRKRGEWKIEDGGQIVEDGKRSVLVVEGLVKLDLGAFGKGKLIDEIATLLNGLSVKNYLIDGGRDFYGTTKVDGSAWMIALEHPFDATMAIGEFPIKNCALACSGISQRKVKDFHHFMDTKTGMPVADPVGVFVSAESAMLADGVSTAIAVSPLNYISRLEDCFPFDYAVVSRNGALLQKGFENYLY